MATKHPPSRLPFLVSSDLLDELDRLYPQGHLPPDSPHHAFIARAAERRLIERLREALNRQAEADPMQNPILNRR